MLSCESSTSTAVFRKQDRVLSPSLHFVFLMLSGDSFILDLMYEQVMVKVRESQIMSSTGQS